nr:glycosyltransferase [Argonema antarcticum]
MGDRIEALGVPVYAIDMTPTPGAIWRLVQIVRQLKPDLIQGWMYHGNLAAQLVKILSLHHIPILWSIHHSINSLASEKKLTQILIRLGSLASKFVDRIIYVSNNSKKQHEALGYFPNNSCVIPNGFNTSLFKPSNEDRLSVREELGLSSDSFLIGSLARYHPMKDHANFIRAAALLVKSFPEVHFLLAGTEIEPQNQILYKLIQDLEIEKQVHLLGERQDVPRLLAALDILTSSSAYGEAFPLIVGEAMSCGVTCVVTDLGDCGWLVGQPKQVVPPRNSEALAAAWKNLIELSSEERKSIGSEARARIIEFFSLDFIVTCYEQIYESILAQKLNPKK